MLYVYQMMETRCNFTNFARNICCLKCKAEGPKKSGESDIEMKKGNWNCPKNMLPLDGVVLQNSVGQFFSKYTPAIDIWSIGCICLNAYRKTRVSLGKLIHQLDLMTDLLGTPPSPVESTGRMLKKLSKQLHGKDWNLNNLNTLYMLGNRVYIWI
ncbi:uncharacterized protein LOC133797950 isoform X2 [Humulus lupulus]|uniref:uncharacterized protein LOC133797950 isoform X2 n=1 Tax=Humulus lupulus TaxID=3486 RepID=UPI002B412A5C|nr:uncharacterized protein LOC133797950 isoform X2 [Humulus lupulus]